MPLFGRPSLAARNAFASKRARVVVKKAKPAPRRAVVVKKAAPKPVVRRAVVVKKPTPARAAATPAASRAPFSQDAEDLRDDDESSSESESEDVGPDEPGDSAEDSGPDSGDDEGEGGEDTDGVGALVDTADPARMIVVGWVVFGVTLSTAMALGWAWGRNHAR